ncbi:transcription elongation factor GreA [Candidatus Kaiserbacteria bacterium]|nr:transcription elongation factor GreA [Candidatus Kaiserbacteria bacterium]
MTDENNYLTQEKFEELTKELEHLKTTKRKEIAESLEYARSLGDLSENAEYQDAREMQAATEERVTQLEYILKDPQIVTHKKSDVISLGSKVSIQKDGEKETHEYILVGSEEADIQKRKISYVSPLGNSMIGKKKGDSFTFETPNGKQNYTIKSVE